jgi:hypothetical protein
LIIGLNYDKQPNIKLRGCINDANNIASVLSSKGITYRLINDNTNVNDTTKSGILRHLRDAMRMSWTNDLEYFIFFYSGHGTFIRDGNYDEKDNRDECIVPNDFQTEGFISDDEINNILKQFNSKTKLVGILDSCFSGTLFDLKYRWNNNKHVIENDQQTNNRIVSISSCLDSQVSKEFLCKEGYYTGALTYYLISLLRNSNNIFFVVDNLNNTFRLNGFKQTANICSSYDLKADAMIFNK